MPSHATLILREPACRYCREGLTAERGHALTVTRDHMQPLALGGGAGENIAAACWRCNVLKADWSLAGFLDAYPDAAAIEAAYPLAVAERAAARWYERLHEGNRLAAQRPQPVAMRSGLTDSERRRRAEVFAAHWLGVQEAERRRLQRLRVFGILAEALRRVSRETTGESHV